MRQILLLFVLWVLNVPGGDAQPIYIQFDPSCMHQLEYRFVYTGAVSNAYFIQPSANEQIQLQAGSQGISSPTMPPGMVSCRNFKFDDQFFNDVNNLSRQVYVVHPQAKGYMLIPVISAAQILRSAQYYLVRARNYSFALDTTNLVYENNIATGSSDWYIYFNGLKFRGCFLEYSFKREPTRSNQERSEFDFIPGVGLTYERTGMTAAEAENNHYRLVKVNNLPLEDYINERCGGRTSPTPPPVSMYTPQVEYGTLREKDKESYSLPGQKPIAADSATPSLPPLVDCPDRPAEGYHIVQPGETLLAISRAYNLSLRSLIAWNRLKDPNRIFVCQKIWLRTPPADAFTSGPSAQPRSPVAAVPPGGNALPVARRQDGYWKNLQSVESTAQMKGAAAPPSVYDVGQPQLPPTYTPQAKTIVHTVQSGETLYGIAVRYGLSEAEVRRLNKYPPTGPVNLQPGMQLLVSDCCPQDAPPTAQPKSAIAPATAATPPPSGGLPSVFNTSPPAPAAYEQPSTAQPEPAVTPTKTTPTYFQEYIVREGDTIQSIALRFKVNAQELAILNNKDLNETLIAGQRILIPRN